LLALQIRMNWLRRSWSFEAKFITVLWWGPVFFPPAMNLLSFAPKKIKKFITVVGVYICKEFWKSTPKRAFSSRGNLTPQGIFTILLVFVGLCRNLDCWLDAGQEDRLKIWQDQDILRQLETRMFALPLISRFELKRIWICKILTYFLYLNHDQDYGKKQCTSINFLWAG
jgi:hypothetical protein